MFYEARMQALADRYPDKDLEDEDNAARATRAAWDPHVVDNEAEPMEETTQPLQQAGTHGSDSQSVNDRPDAAGALATFTADQFQTAMRAAVIAASQTDA